MKKWMIWRVAGSPILGNPHIDRSFWRYSHIASGPDAATLVRRRGFLGLPGGLELSAGSPSVCGVTNQQQNGESTTKNMWISESGQPIIYQNILWHFRSSGQHVISHPVLCEIWHWCQALMRRLHGASLRFPGKVWGPEALKVGKMMSRVKLANQLKWYFGVSWVFLPLQNLASGKSTVAVVN